MPQGIKNTGTPTGTAPTGLKLEAASSEGATLLSPNDKKKKSTTFQMPQELLKLKEMMSSTSKGNPFLDLIGDAIYSHLAPHDDKSSQHSSLPNNTVLAHPLPSIASRFQQVEPGQEVDAAGTGFRRIVCLTSSEKGEKVFEIEINNTGDESQTVRRTPEEIALHLLLESHWQVASQPRTNSDAGLAAPASKAVEIMNGLSIQKLAPVDETAEESRQSQSASGDTPAPAVTSNVFEEYSNVDAREKTEAFIQEQIKITNSPEATAWLGDKGLVRVHNAGNGNNCLLISLLQHATGIYDDSHNDEARALRQQILAHKFQGVEESNFLLPGSDAVNWAISAINEKYKKELRLVTFQLGKFASADESQKEDFTMAIDYASELGRQAVAVLGTGNHFEAVIAKQETVDLPTSS